MICPDFDQIATNISRMPDGKRSQLCSKKLFEPKFVNCLEVLGITKEPDHYDSNISATTSNLKLVAQ